VSGAGFFHLDLYAAVFRVDIVENLFARFAVVECDVAVEVFVDVDDGSNAAQTQAQVIETGGLFSLVDAAGGFMSSRRHGA